jgi:predicted outer membrane repeat protein
MFHVNQNASLKLYGVEVSDNTTSSNHNSAWGAGAVLACNTGITMDIAYSAFRNNSSTDSTYGNGGAIVVRSGTANIRNTIFSGNTANVNGGALYVCKQRAMVLIRKKPRTKRNKPWLCGLFSQPLLRPQPARTDTLPHDNSIQEHLHFPKRKQQTRTAAWYNAMDAMCVRRKGRMK